MRRTSRAKPPWKRVAGLIVYASFCLVALGAGTFAGWIGQSEMASQITWDLLKRTKPVEAWNGKQTVNLLILGCDEERYYGGKQILKDKARSDMMLVAKLDFAKNRISGVSIPRDTLAAPDGYRQHKINAFHVFGGPELSKKAVESILPVKIDRVVVLDFHAFQEMVNILGGIDVFVSKRMKHTDKRGGLYIDLKPGRQHLNGYEAMGFVRYRNDDDFRRQARQKDFMLAFKDAVLRKPTLLPRVADQARLAMGGSLSKEEISSLALFARSVGSDNIKMGMIPTVQARGFDLRVDRGKLDDVLREFHIVETRSNRSTVSLKR